MDSNDWGSIHLGFIFHMQGKTRPAIPYSHQHCPRGFSPIRLTWPLSTPSSPTEAPKEVSNFLNMIQIYLWSGV